MTAKVSCGRVPDRSRAAILKMTHYHASCRVYSNWIEIRVGAAVEVELARKRNPFAARTMQRFGYTFEREKPHFQCFERMRVQFAAVDAAVKEHRIDVPSGRAQLEAVSYADQP